MSYLIIDQGCYYVGVTGCYDPPPPCDPMPEPRYDAERIAQILRRAVMTLIRGPRSHLRKERDYG